jgi:hypothetical protein
MLEAREPRPITVTQIVGVLALAVIVVFIIAFASKAISTYRLRVWRDDLQAEIARMDVERQDLLLEMRRRQSKPWIDQALRQTGQMPPDVLSVRLVSPEPSRDQTHATRLDDPGPTITERVQGLAFFDNPNWDAWTDLLLDRP